MFQDFQDSILILKILKHLVNPVYLLVTPLLRES